MRTDSVGPVGPWLADDNQDTQPHTDLGTKAEPTRKSPLDLPKEASPGLDNDAEPES